MRLSELIECVVQDATTANFAELTTLTDNAADESCDYVATIGFAGKEFRGALAWGCSRAAALGLCGMGEVPDDVLRDWVGEMANQLLGRVKNKLIAHEIDFALSTPMVIAGAELEVASARDERTSAFVNTAFGCLRVIFSYAADPNMSFREVPEQVAANEGDAFLF